MTRNEFQKLHDFDDATMAFLEVSKNYFDGRITDGWDRGLGRWSPSAGGAAKSGKEAEKTVIQAAL